MMMDVVGTECVVEVMSAEFVIFHLTRSSDKLVGFLSSDSVFDVLEIMWGVVWSNALIKVPYM